MAFQRYKFKLVCIDGIIGYSPVVPMERFISTPFSTSQSSRWDELVGNMKLYPHY